MCTMSHLFALKSEIVLCMLDIGHQISRSVHLFVRSIHLNRLFPDRDILLPNLGN